MLNLTVLPGESIMSTTLDRLTAELEQLKTTRDRVDTAITKVGEAIACLGHTNGNGVQPTKPGNGAIDAWLTTREAGRRLGITSAGVLWRIRAGTLKAKRVQSDVSVTGYEYRINPLSLI